MTPERAFKEPKRQRGELSSRVNTPMSTAIHFVSTLIIDAWLSIKDWSIAKKILVALGLTIALVGLAIVDVPSISMLRSWAEQSGNAFILLFCGLYVVITQFPVPRTVLTLAAGILFGPVLGSVIALICTTVSAAISLLIVRGLLGAWMKPRLKHPAVERINTRLEHRGWLAIASLRMIAAVPFAILNYVAALTSVPLGAFCIATLIGSAPGTIATVVLGDAFTGSGNWTAIAFTVLLGVLGLFGIFLDQRLPVKPEK